MSYLFLLPAFGFFVIAIYNLIKLQVNSHVQGKINDALTRLDINKQRGASSEDSDETFKELDDLLCKAYAKGKYTLVLDTINRIEGRGIAVKIPSKGKFYIHRDAAC